MNRKITVWENDMTDEIDNKTFSFISQLFPGYEVDQLSALSHRDKEDIFDSLRDSYAIVIQPNLIEPPQIKELAQLISHPIHLNYHSNKRDWDIQRFVFVSIDPWNTLQQIRTILADVRDSLKTTLMFSDSLILTWQLTNWEVYNGRLIWKRGSGIYADKKQVWQLQFQPLHTRVWQRAGRHKMQELCLADQKAIR